jgi:flavin reductase (DIM6/NTAB) family NADH-FMN oxidoreductase RutF
MKEDMELWKARRLLNHSPLILLTSSARGRDNVMTVAWSIPLSHGAPLLGVAVSKDCFSHELVSKSMEFAINIPDRNLLETVKMCGTTSGRDIDKFRSFGLTKERAEKVSAPLIKECFASIEVRVINTVDCDDHTLFIGEVLRCTAEKGAMDATLDISRYATLHHLGEDVFAVTKRL